MIIIVPRNESQTYVALCQSMKWSRLYWNRTPTPYPGEQWMLDNGAYQAYIHQKPWPRNTWLRTVTQCQNKNITPHIAVLPDIVAGGMHSLHHSIAHLDLIPPTWPKYLAVQDGIQPKHIPQILATKLSGIMLGGTTEYKRKTDM